jgi:hypothetical protein
MGLLVGHAILTSGEVKGCTHHFGVTDLLKMGTGLFFSRKKMVADGLEKEVSVS